jgi:uncharacterized membrane protein
VRHVEPCGQATETTHKGQSLAWSVMMLDTTIITLYAFVLGIIFMGLDEVSKPMMI